MGRLQFLQLFSTHFHLLLSPSFSVPKIQNVNSLQGHVEPSMLPDYLGGSHPSDGAAMLVSTAFIKTWVVHLITPRDPHPPPLSLSLSLSFGVANTCRTRWKPWCRSASGKSWSCRQPPSPEALEPICTTTPAQVCKTCLRPVRALTLVLLLPTRADSDADEDEDEEDYEKPPTPPPRPSRPPPGVSADQLANHLEHLQATVVFFVFFV